MKSRIQYYQSQNIFWMQVTRAAKKCVLIFCEACAEIISASIKKNERVKII
jgi:hypothetical protein